MFADLFNRFSVMCKLTGWSRRPQAKLKGLLVRTQGFSQGPSFQCGKKDRKNSPLRELGWTSVTGKMLNLQDTSNKTKDEPCSGGTMSKMLTDKEQHSQSKVRHLHRWQRQIFWTSFAKLRGIGGEGSDELLSVHDAHQISEITRSQDSSTSMIKKLGRSCGFYGEEFAQSPAGRPSVQDHAP